MIGPNEKELMRKRGSWERNRFSYQAQQGGLFPAASRNPHAPCPPTPQVQAVQWRASIPFTHKGEPQPQRYDFWEQEKRIDTLRPISKRTGTEGKATGYKIRSPWQINVAAAEVNSYLIDLLQACPFHVDPSKNKSHRARLDFTTLAPQLRVPKSSEWREHIGTSP
ncbi:hypothetical protein MYCTH_2129720 [Thermothelomyces thermophilus ATCC 42464]|uniref:Uncharacterized protein n=1 Tax=Thermothelomyces thermophilus (strain ATCC 42464 / BCRC 31852 / DSM 1799) TaxID=573729 RepID=G2QKX9_THET4|nr:uncharacterized protein MYCTH_2129720 [Thermothelomyces thermophilus ATCC 42464]AEO60611.1 hypothetical protein MYCTH_2129720 [Thermothelomyces thermophilus ATCC 42464]